VCSKLPLPKKKPDSKQASIVENNADGLATWAEELTACSFCWFGVTESTVRWFVVREKQCWMSADSANILKGTRC
jgi:hypothetical protein